MNEEQLLKYLQEIIIGSIITRIAESDLTKDEQAEKLVNDIGYLLDQFGVAVDQVIPDAIIKHYFGGVDSATKALEESKIKPRPMQRKIHMEAVQSIMDDTMMDMHAAIRTAKKSAAKSVSNAINNVKGDIAKGIITGDTRKVIQKRVAESFQKDGLTAFVTVDGKKLPLDFYSMTVTRTKMRDAAVTGSVERYKENDQDLVQIIENSDTCPVCARYRGLVVSLTGETPGYPVVGKNGIQLPPYHPNCRGSVRPFVLEFKTEAEIAEAKKRNAAYDPEKDPRTPAQKRAYEREQTARRKANDEKKQFARWQMALGDGAPRTLGAFRRMKRANSAKFQELQSEYRRIMREDVI
ncbi:phage minor capsid protein [Siminovitchia terrae]|uniref:phage minor capsid protein n=1 Tax=Siminovitchia terrae TaxID=1914933 RepID=UPI0028B230C0|nr:phage minor capsid protein [Siminovitchia terrae]